MSGVDRLLARFHRETASGRYVPEVDGLRCLAIAGVILFHVAGFVAERSPGGFGDVGHDPAYRLARTGHVGVQLFFVISGMVVAIPFARRHLAAGPPVLLRDFYLRRLTRIEPPYVIALCFWLVAMGLGGKAGWPALFRSFPWSLTYLHNARFGEPSAVMPPAWSLEIEVQFYLLAPGLTLVYALRRGRRLILGGSIAALTIAQHWWRQPGQLNGLHAAHEGQHFLVGLLLADLFVTRWREAPADGCRAGDHAATAALLALLAVLFWRESTAVYWTPPLLLLLVGGGLRGRWWLAALRNRWAYTVGGMCYTIYLYHGFFKAVAGRLTVPLRLGNAFGPNLLLQLALLGPAILIGSAVLFLLTEKPFMRARRPVSGGARRATRRA